MHLLDVSIRITHEKVVSDGSAEEAVALRYIYKIAACICIQRTTSAVCVYVQSSGLRLEKRKENSDERALAYSGRTYYCCSAARLEVMSEIMKDILIRIRICKRDVPQTDSGSTCKENPVFRYFTRKLLEFKKTIDRSSSMDDGRNLAAHLHKRPLNLSDQLEEGSHHTVCNNTSADSENSPYESYRMTGRERQRNEYAGNHTETSTLQLIAIQCILEALKFIGAAVCVFQRLEKGYMLYAFLYM